MINIFDFSKIYKLQSFYKDYKYKYYDLSNMNSVSCYCSDESRKYLQELISNVDIKNINYIDSGNYHYMSLFTLSQINTDFELILFDNHPDFKSDTLLPILSCASWVYEVIKNLSFLKKITFYGVDPALIIENTADFKNLNMSNILFDESNRIYVYQKEQCKNTKLPVYLSIDKDVLSYKYANTTWSQGIMTLQQLTCKIHNIAYNHHILGVDICGECDNFDLNYMNNNHLNELANRQILNSLYDLF